MASRPGSVELEELTVVVAVATRILAHRLQPRVPADLTIHRPLNASVDAFLAVARNEADPREQAVGGALWGARRLRDDFLVGVAFDAFAHRRMAIDLDTAERSLDRHLEWTSESHFGETLYPDDARLARPFSDYTIPELADGTMPFWIGARWGAVRWHGLAKLGLRARRAGEDILAEWEEFQVAVPVT